MAINLSSKSADKLLKKCALKSSVLTGAFSEEYSFSGAKTVVVTTAQTVKMKDYKREGTNRYGMPEEMQDITQELTLTQDKSYSLTVDKGNFKDQNYLKKVQDVIEIQNNVEAIPTRDRYCLAKASKTAGNIVGNSTALTKSNICERISTGTQALDDAEVPSENRTLFINAANYKLLKLSPEFLGVETLAEKVLTKGYVGMYDDMKVVKVPKGRWPENVNFIIVQKSCATAPQKIAETKVHKDPPGISGNLVEGRNYYDFFVFGARCEGVYVEVDTSSDKGSVLKAPTIAAAGGAISGVSGATYYYTTDGSDPRYSTTRLTGQPSSPEVGTIIKAYAEQAGKFPSPVAEMEITG